MDLLQLAAGVFLAVRINLRYLCLMAVFVSLLRPVHALMRLTRFWNLVIIATTQYFTAFFLIETFTIRDGRLFLLVGSTLMIAAAGYIINDYYDIKIDLINKPQRVVIGRGITRRYAIFFHSALSLAGIAIGFLLGWAVGVVNLASVFFLWAYSNNLKRQPFTGNFLVALLTGAAIGIVNLLYPPVRPSVIIFWLFAVVITLVREIIKDMEDMKGDQTFGCKTLPIIWGIRKTKRLLYILLALFAVLALWVNRFYVGLPLYYFLLFLYVPLIFLLARLVRADTISDFARLSSFCKVIMLLGILSMAWI